MKDGNVFMLVLVGTERGPPHHRAAPSQVVVTPRLPLTLHTSSAASCHEATIDPCWPYMSLEAFLNLVYRARSLDSAPLYPHTFSSITLAELVKILFDKRPSTLASDQRKMSIKTLR